MLEEVSVGVDGSGIDGGHELLCEVVEAKKDAMTPVDGRGGEEVRSTVGFAPCRPDGGLKTRCVASEFSHSSMIAMCPLP